MRWMVAVALVGCGGNNGGDCADNVEIPYDGLDQDCDGADLVDVDGDGYPGSGDVDFDCDDTADTVHPDAAEVPYDGIDQNCFEGDLVDVDGDGFPGEAVGGGDCNDDDPKINPEYPDQLGDGIDRDCDGVDGRDHDGDGWASVASRGTDCDDEQPSVHPGATEVWYDGLDQDCAGDCDYDLDGDGAVLAGAPVPDQSPCDRVAGPGAGAPVDCDDEDPAVGEVSVLSITPADGATEVLVTTDVTVVLSAADPSASIVVRDAAGGAVDGGASSADALTWTWSSAADLAGGETYTVDLTYACGPIASTFTTEYPALVVDPTSLVGRVWEVDLVAATLTEPANSAAIFAADIDHALRFEVTGAGPDSLALRVAPAVGGAQDLCHPTTDSGADLAGNPDFVAGPGDWAYAGVVGGGDVLPFDLLDATLSASVRGGGDLLEDAVVTGWFDTRPMVLPLFGAGAAEDALCAQVAVVGDTCAACPDGTGAFCLPARFEGAPAVDVGVAITPRTAGDVDADPSCP